MKIIITDINQPSPDSSASGNQLIPKTKLLEALKTLADRPQEEIPLLEVKDALEPFLSDLADKEIYEKTSGYVQILDEVLRQIKITP